MTFNWGSADTFEFRMAAMSSAILSELTGGICCNAADDIWYDNATIVEDMYKEIVEYENSINPQDWIVHPFSQWE